MRFLLLFLFPALLLANIGALAQQEAVDLYASSDFGVKGEIVSIEIKVKNFVDILSFQASLNWDPSLLSYTGVADFGIEDFSENNFGTTSTNQGHLRFLWEPSDALAVTIVDSTLLFTASFEIISDQPQDVPIGYLDVISSPAFPVEFANKDFEIVSVVSYDGEVTIISDYKDLVNITSNPNTSCDEKVANGSLIADVAGNTADYDFLWFIGSELKATPDFTGNLYTDLQAGNYTLQVQNSDGSIFVEKMDTAVLNNPSGIPGEINVITNIAQSSCSTDPLKLTGEIEIAVNDAQPSDTHSISWWKGTFDDGEELTVHQDQYKANTLDAGTYEVRVENSATTCASYHRETIADQLVQFSPILTMTKNNFCADGANGGLHAEVPEDSQLDLRYFWFEADDGIDTTMSLGKGQHLTNLPMGNYKSWIIDLLSECSAAGPIAVENELIFSEAIIEQRNDTLYANVEHAQWFRNEIDLQIASGYIVPETSGDYYFEIINEFNCVSQSEELFYGITSLDKLSDDFHVYPNPFHDYVRVLNPEENISYIRIMDGKGVLLKEIYNIKNKFIDLHLNGSSNGLYLLNIHKAGKSMTTKVIKNHLK